MEKGSGWTGDDVGIFLFFLFSFPYVFFSFLFFLYLFLSSCNESDISFVPLKPCRRRELLLLKKTLKKVLLETTQFPLCGVHKVAGGNVWSSAWQVNGRTRRVFSVTPQTTP